MKFLRIFRLPKPQAFTYMPRYYDEAKESREQLINSVRAMEDGGVDGMKSRISDGLKRRSGSTSIQGRRQAVILANMRVFVITIVLCAILFYIINSNLDRILEALS